MAGSAARAGEEVAGSELVYRMSRNAHSGMIHILIETGCDLGGGMHGQGVPDVSLDSAAPEQCRGLNRSAAEKENIGLDDELTRHLSTGGVVAANEPTTTVAAKGMQTKLHGISCGIADSNMYSAAMHIGPASMSQLSEKPSPSSSSPPTTVTRSVRLSGSPNAKTGAAVRKQAPVVVNNIMTLIKSENDLLNTPRYNGYSSCPIVTGYGKMVLAEFDYDNKAMPTFPLLDTSKELWLMWLMKKYMLPWVYWERMLKGRPCFGKCF